MWHQDSIQNYIQSFHWAEKHRALSVDAGYLIREVFNDDIDRPTFTSNQQYMKRYQYRSLSSEILYFNEQVTTYNNTVAIYHWREDRKVGVEIISESYATMMRKVFENYWQLAKPSV
jgi:hypothetical protein